LSLSEVIIHEVFYLLFCMGVKLGPTTQKEHRFRVFENRVLRRILGPVRQEVRCWTEDYIMRHFII